MKIGTRTTNPGELRTQISLEQPTSSQDSGGFTTRSYTAVATVYAKWENLHGVMLIQSGISANRLPARVLLRYRTDIDPSWTVVKDGQRYEITGFDNISDRGEYLELLLKTYVGG